MRSEIAALKAGGYHVTLIRNDLPIDKALEASDRKKAEAAAASRKA